MRQGNGYVVIFAVLMTVICGGLLAGVAVGLKETHKEQELLNKQKKILSAAFSDDAKNWDNKTFKTKYAEMVSGIVIDINGDTVKVENKKGELVQLNPIDVDPKKEYKKANVADKRFPVFVIRDEVYPDSPEKSSYVIPVYGGGLWNDIWGYIAIGADRNTVKGAVFEHASETPGLGARIADDAAFQARFEDKKVKDADNKIVSITVEKGEGKDYSDNPHKIDGLSGASMTTGGLNDMLSSYFKFFESFLNK